MNLTKTKKALAKLITEKHVNIDEYQDKFYFKKQIQEMFPDLREDIIINAINYANSVVKFPRRKSEFIDALCKKMLELN